MRAQIQMFETIGIIIVFLFLITLASIFYFSAQKSSLEKEKITASQKYALQITLNAINMPELDCSFLLTSRDNCIDQLKLSSIQNILTEQTALSDYFVEFGYATITVTEIYPSNINYTIYSNQPVQFETKQTSQSPILLYDPIQNTYSFGVIEVAIYE